MSEGYAVTSMDALGAIPAGESRWRPIRRALEVTSVGIAAFTADAGQEVIEPHDETSPNAGAHEEVYLVITGSAEFTVAGERIAAPAGTLIRIDVGVHRVAVATEEATTVLVVGGRPGAAMPPSAFEHWYAAQGPYSRGDFEGAVDVASAGLADHPDNPSLHYQLACYHALAGHTDEALEHLAVAVAGRPETADWAAEDSDLDSIRNEPGFPSS